MKKVIIVVVVLLVLGAAGAWYWDYRSVSGELEEIEHDVYTFTDPKFNWHGGERDLQLRDLDFWEGYLPKIPDRYVSARKQAVQQRITEVRKRITAPAEPKPGG